MMNLVGCNGCQSDNNAVAETVMQGEDGGHNPELKVSIQGETIYAGQKRAKIIIVNESGKEINFDEDDFNLVVYAPNMTHVGFFSSTSKADMGEFGKFKIAGVDGILSAKEIIFSLKTLLQGKKLGANQKLALPFTFTSITEESKIAYAEVSMEIIDANGLKVSESPAKVIWKYKKTNWF
jgi:hypothetical protein